MAIPSYCSEAAQGEKSFPLVFFVDLSACCLSFSLSPLSVILCRSGSAAVPLPFNSDFLSPLSELLLSFLIIITRGQKRSLASAIHTLLGELALPSSALSFSEWEWHKGQDSFLCVLPHLCLLCPLPLNQDNREGPESFPPNFSLSFVFLFLSPLPPLLPVIEDRSFSLVLFNCPLISSFFRSTHFFLFPVFILWKHNNRQRRTTMAAPAITEINDEEMRKISKQYLEFLDDDVSVMFTSFCVRRN